MNKEFNEILTGIKRAISLLTPREKKSLIFATLVMSVAGVLTNLPAIILGKFVDKLFNLSTISFNIAAPFLILIIVIILVKESLNVLWKYLIENIATQIDKDQTVKVIDRLLKTDIRGFLQQRQIGSLHGRIFRSMQGLILILKLTFREFAPIFFSAIAAIGIALFQKPLIATMMILVIPTGLYLITKQISSQKGIRMSLLRGKEQVDGKVVEMLGGIETIRTLNTASSEIGKIEQLAEKMRKIEIRHHIYMALYDSAKYLNESFFYIAVIIVSIILASKGMITKGDILVYSILFLSITSPLREIHKILDQAHESSIRVNDLYDLLHEPLDESFKPSESKLSNDPKNLILQVSGLKFSYHENPERLGLLNGITINIKEGESIGMAGVSGCGKTTFVHILLKLIHGYTGKVTLFGKDLSSIERIEIAKKIAYVPQRPFIFSGTIKDNIIYGMNRKVSDDEIIEAAKKARIYAELINSLGGLNGKITENGSNLSGGQRQRLAIARVMLESPEFIIFDEATSALDNTNEAFIQQNIEEVFNKKTIITIAHRLTTLKNCDRIFVFDKGKIAQEGDFETLANRKGLFMNFLKQRIQL